MTDQRTMIPALALGLALPLAAHAPATAHEPRTIDLAICLDTSGSMNGLIDAARQNVWAIVNDLALAKPAPKLRLALLTFGNNGHPSEVGWVHVDSPLTDDLDIVSRQLFALTTNGGEEYVGRVLQAALEQLDWSKDPGALKLIVVAGNEAADQDPQVDFRVVASQAIARGIVVNSIYCGNGADALAPLWREVSQRADGQFATIDQNNGTVVVETPFDTRLGELSAALNETYLPYGEKGAWAAGNQAEQDANAAGLNGAAAAQRAFCKTTANYVCAWDLVDALANKSVELAKLKPEELPEAMRAMTPEQREQHVAEMAKRRGEVQAEIKTLHDRREVFVAEEMKRRAVDGSAAFEFAVRGAVKAQAEAKGFAFPPPIVPAPAQEPASAGGETVAPGNGAGVTPASPASGTPAGGAGTTPPRGSSPSDAPRPGVVSPGGVKK